MSFRRGSRSGRKNPKPPEFRRVEIRPGIVVLAEASRAAALESASAQREQEKAEREQRRRQNKEEVEKRKRARREKKRQARRGGHLSVPSDYGVRGPTYVPFRDQLLIG